MTTTHETEIVVDAKVPLVRIIREFDAAPEKVFRAHADPELFAQWIGPHGMKTSVDHFDCRTGGAYRYVQSDADGEYGFHGSFHDVRPGELIVQTFGFEGMPDGVVLEKISFEDLGGGRTRLVGTSLCDSFEDRDAFVASGMDVGVREGYERLDEILARD